MSMKLLSSVSARFNDDLQLKLNYIMCSKEFNHSSKVIKSLLVTIKVTNKDVAILNEENFKIRKTNLRMIKIIYLSDQYASLNHNKEQSLTVNKRSTSILTKS